MNYQVIDLTTWPTTGELRQILPRLRLEPR
jgi:hypothetical protein